MASAKSSALTKYEPSAFPVLADGEESAALREVVEENLGGQSLGAFDLPRLRVPPGGADRWGNGEKEIVGVIIFQSPGRSYWKDPLGTGSSRPDCRSLDGRNGEGTPGGECFGCPLNEWDSGEGGRSKACTESHRLFVLEPGKALPSLLILPPTSLGAGKEYMVSLTQDVIPYWAALTRFTLVPDKNQDGKPFSRVSLEFVDAISPNDREALKAYRAGIIPSLKQVEIVSDRQDVSIAATED
jgi:hypothetical protein